MAGAAVVRPVLGWPAAEALHIQSRRSAECCSAQLASRSLETTTRGVIGYWERRIADRQSQASQKCNQRRLFLGRKSCQEFQTGNRAFCQPGRTPAVPLVVGAESCGVEELLEADD
jgi:hypothetical protein